MHELPGNVVVCVGSLSLHQGLLITTWCQRLAYCDRTALSEELVVTGGLTKLRSWPPQRPSPATPHWCGSFTATGVRLCYQRYVVCDCLCKPDGSNCKRVNIALLSRRLWYQEGHCPPYFGLMVSPTIITDYRPHLKACHIRTSFPPYRTHSYSTARSVSASYLVRPLKYQSC
jgi:hypothetical protein